MPGYYSEKSSRDAPAGIGPSRRGWFPPGKESVLGVEAKLGGDRAGGMLFLRHGSTATYHIGWSSPDGREENASNLLLWQAIRLLKKKGVATLDLGGVDTDHAPGLAHFKLGLGGRPLSQSGTWLLRPKLF